MTAHSLIINLRVIKNTYNYDTYNLCSYSLSQLSFFWKMDFKRLSTVNCRWNEMANDWYLYLMILFPKVTILDMDLNVLLHCFVYHITLIFFLSMKTHSKVVLICYNILRWKCLLFSLIYDASRDPVKICEFVHYQDLHKKTYQQNLLKLLLPIT